MGIYEIRDVYFVWKFFKVWCYINRGLL